MFLDKDIY